MNYIYVAIISVISSLITYFIFKLKANKADNKITTTTEKTTEIKIESTATSEIKIDGNKIEKDLKKSYDEMVGRL